LTCNQYGDGKAFYFATPLLTAHGENEIPAALLQCVFEIVAPLQQRQLTVDAPDTVEVVLREQGNSKVVHLVNMAPGDRETRKSAKRQYVTVHRLPTVPSCRVSVRSKQMPSRVTLQPTGRSPAQWEFQQGRVLVTVPEFSVHQMVVIEF
jgi:hypothetical protein